MALQKNRKWGEAYRLPLILVGIVSLILFPACQKEGINKVKFDIDSLDTGTRVSIRALHVVDQNIVWAGGSVGTFLLTADGGETWKKGIVPGVGNDEFRSIYAWNAEQALLFGVLSPGRGFLTTTTGENWEKVYEIMSRRIFFNSVSFADKDNGIALSDPIDSTTFLIRTSDGGKSWKRMGNLPPLKPGEAHFAASNSCIDYHQSGRIWFVTGGAEARLFMSSDNGESWEVRNTGLVHGDNASGCFAVKFFDDRRGIIVGGTFNQPEQNDKIAAFTNDGGNTWQLSEKMPSQYCSSVAWLGEKGEIAVAAGKTGIDYSTDGGNKWSHLSDEGFYTIQAVPGSFEGYAAGKGGRISKFRLKSQTGDK